MPARTSAAVAPKAAKCFKFLDVIMLSPFCFEYRYGFGRCADYRRHSEIARFLAHGECLKLVWSFSEAYDLLCHKFSLSRNLMARLRRWSSSR
jgi:hypothetical protein